MAKVIGLTGSFGTGKTFVASIFGRLGAVVLDADKIARFVVAKGRPAYRKIVKAFGVSILGRDREIDRKKLAAVVFADKRMRLRLERIVHPEVIALIKKGIRKAGSDGIVVVDAPLLVEARLAGIADVLVVVTSPRERQIERCMDKFCMKRSDVLKRIGSQIPLKRKAEMADFVVDNGGLRSGTEKQVRKVWKEILWR
jgi:dephospho-CoA kinase